MSLTVGSNGSNGSGGNGSLFKFSFGRFADSFMNMLAGLGVSGRDKVMSHEPYVDLLNDQQRLEALYRSNWLAEKIINVPAFDATRAWRQWQAKENEIEALEEAERALGLQNKLRSALIKSRLYGGAAMIIGIKNQDFTKELDLDKVGKGDLVFVHAVEKWTIQAGSRVRDIMSPWFGEPEYYMRSNTPATGAAGGEVEALETFKWGEYGPGQTIYIHPSRVVRLIGIDYPDIEHAPDAWGDSVLQPAWEALRHAGLVSSSMANMVADAKVDVFKIPGLTATLSTMEGTNKLVSYLGNANVAKSTINSLVLDKEIEWDRINTHFEGMPEVLQAFLLICAAAADIPATRLLGREPTGMNATGDSDIRNYYDRLSSDQKVRLTPALTRLDEVLIRHTLGRRPKEIHYEWNSLWQLSDAEKASINLQKAQAFQIDVNTALIPPEALQKGRENQLIEDGTYPGLDAALDEVEEREKKMAEEFDLPDQPQQPLPGQPGGGQPQPGQEQEPSIPTQKPAAQTADAFDWEDDWLFEDADWDESKHPRGQPDNRGKFGPGGGGGGEPKPRAPAAPAAPAAYSRGNRVRVAEGPHKGVVGIIRSTMHGNEGTRHFVRFDQPSAGKVGEAFSPKQLASQAYKRPAVPNEQQQMRETLTGHPGHGYSVHAKLKGGVIYTHDVHDATRALFEGRKVVLDQPKQVSTLLDHLGDVSARMIALRERHGLSAKIPNFNLCNVSVAGTNLFCADTKGIPRTEMPQLDKKQTKAFLKSLKDEGVHITKEKEKASYLRATQNQLIGAKVADLAERLERGEAKEKRIVVSKDDYILDGHHHWAATIGLDAINNKLGDKKMKIARVDMGIIELLKKAEKFSGPHVGADSADLFDALDELDDDWLEELCDASPPRVRVQVFDPPRVQLVGDDFDPAKHPHGEHGWWATTGSEGGSEGAKEHAISEQEHNYGLVPGDVAKFHALKGQFAQINNDLLGLVDKPDGPEAQAKIDQLEGIVKAIQGLHADPGTPAGIGLPGGPRDVTIVGAGPGGLAAGYNGAMEGLDTLVVEANAIAGGQAKFSSRIENYGGFPIGITGARLTQDMFEQTTRMGAEAKLGTQVTSMTYDEKTGLKRLTLSNGEHIDSRTVILAGGLEFHRMSFPGSDGPGVIVADPKALAAAGAGGRICVIGGSNGAAQAALGCAQFSEHVYVLARSPIAKNMSKSQVDALRYNPKITVIESDSIARLFRDEHGNPQIVETVKGQRLPVKAIGEFIGGLPNTKWVPTTIVLDKKGKVQTNSDLETSLPGVYAVGDVRSGGPGRVLGSAGEGQMALRHAHMYLAKQQKPVADSAAAKDNTAMLALITRLADLDRANPWFGQTVEVEPLKKKSLSLDIDDLIWDHVNDADWDPSKHPRGHEGNVGQFGAGGGGESQPAAKPTLAERVAASRARVAGHERTRATMREYAAGNLTVVEARAKLLELGHPADRVKPLMREAMRQSNVQRLAQFNKLASEARERGLDFPASTTVLSRWRSENRLQRVKEALGITVPAHEAPPPTRRGTRGGPVLTVAESPPTIATTPTPAPVSRVEVPQVVPATPPAAPAAPAVPKVGIQEKDFTDAGVQLRMPDASKPRFIQTWNERIKEPPAKFKQDFYGGHDMPMTIESSFGGTIYVRGSGGGVTAYSNSIDFPNKEAHLGLFTVAAGQQHHGLAKKVMAGNIDFYRDHGIEKVTLLANISVGGYAWARYGFVPNNWRDVSRHLGYSVDNLQATTREKGRLRELLRSSDPKTMWDIADSKFGKQLLLGKEDWEGTLDLKDRDSNERFDAYVKPHA